MRSSFNVTTQDIDDEIRAIKALRDLGEHRNLVRILQDGPLDHSTYHFIDMDPKVSSSPIKILKGDQEDRADLSRS
jgi:hypothetical protein